MPISPRSAVPTAVSGARRIRTNLPGLLLSVIVGMSATFVSNAYGGPTILFALLLGMAFNFLSAEPRVAPGLDFAAKFVLRVGVALLGARITATQIVALGWPTLAGVVAAVALTIGVGIMAATVLRLKSRFGVLTAGAVAICGASAAAAISAVLPRYDAVERDTAFTIIGVTTLSTVAMVLYPVIARAFGLSHADVGVFLGGTIHDVAQVVGAGYSVSPETGDIATIIKLLRVALLLPVVLIISAASRRISEPGGGKPALIPGFLVAFVAIVVLNSFGLVPHAVQTILSDASRWCIVTAIAALGIKTALVAMAAVGRRAIGLMVGETIFLALFVLVLVRVE